MHTSLPQNTPIPVPFSHPVSSRPSLPLLSSGLLLGPAGLLLGSVGLLLGSASRVCGSASRVCGSRPLRLLTIFYVMCVRDHYRRLPGAVCAGPQA
eukprot:3369078-Pyramimonas_sp.AAC.2